MGNAWADFVRRKAQTRREEQRQGVSSWSRQRRSRSDRALSPKSALIMILLGRTLGLEDLGGAVEEAASTGGLHLLSSVLAYGRT